VGSTGAVSKGLLEGVGAADMIEYGLPGQQPPSGVQCRKSLRHPRPFAGFCHGIKHLQVGHRCCYG
jgi:hypothetical protein